MPHWPSSAPAEPSALTVARQQEPELYAASANVCPYSSVDLGVRCLRCRPADFASGDEGTELACTVLGVGRGEGGGAGGRNVLCQAFLLPHIFPFTICVPEPFLVKMELICELLPFECLWIEIHFPAV